MKKYFLSLISCLLSVIIMAQRPLLKLATPFKEKNTVNSSRQYITGATCKGCKLSINDTMVRVWPTGAFAYQIDLQPGDTSFQIKTKDENGKFSEKTIYYSYKVPDKIRTTTTATIDYIKVWPTGDLILREGDRIRFTLKTLPACKVMLDNGFELKEVPVDLADTNAVQGIYKGEYVVNTDDTLFAAKKQLRFFVNTPGGQQLNIVTKNFYELLPQRPLILQTKGKLPFLLEGLGEDRLGGTKIGYLDSMVRLLATGKVGNKYRVRLSKNHEAYIEDQYVDVLTDGSFSPSSLTYNMKAWGDSMYDYVSVILNERLPYKTYHDIDPSRIIIDIYGATANTNWITQYQTIKEIRNLYYIQAEDDVFRITIELNHHQHWGHAIYYNGNTLIIRVKRQPPVLQLKNLVIGVDAGHGGSNTGASGALGIYEKEITLMVANDLKKALEKEGATVLMTRTKDTTYDNLDRILLYRQLKPDIVISIHLNSSADPIRVQGTSTYYKYIGFRPLTQHIHRRMLELGLQDYGNVGNFNFMLNSPIEYPNVLVETLFISHPEDEMHVLDESFRKQMVGKIIEGVKDWLLSCNH